MNISVNLYATLRQYAPDGRSRHFELSIPAKATAGNVFDILGIPENVDTVLLVNGRHADRNTHLSARDSITLYPTITGG